MEIPNYIEAPMVDKEGKLTSEWKSTMINLISELQKNYSQEGLRVPQQETGNVTKLDNSKSQGALLYNKTTHKLLINLDGAFKEVQTT